MPDTKVARELCGVAETDEADVVVVVGGRSNAVSKSGTYEIFDSENNEWTIFEDELLNPNEEFVCLLFNQASSAP